MSTDTTDVAEWTAAYHADDDFDIHRLMRYVDELGISQRVVRWPRQRTEAELFVIGMAGGAISKVIRYRHEDMDTYCSVQSLGKDALCLYDVSTAEEDKLLDAGVGHEILTHRLSMAKKVSLGFLSQRDTRPGTPEDVRAMVHVVKDMRDAFQNRPAVNPVQTAIAQ